MSFTLWILPTILETALQASRLTFGSKFPDEEEYYRNGQISQPLEFPPGCRKRICNFVNEVEQLYQTDHQLYKENNSQSK